MKQEKYIIESFIYDLCECCGINSGYYIKIDDEYDCNEDGDRMEYVSEEHALTQILEWNNINVTII